MTANLFLLLLTIQTSQVWPYTVMPDNSSEMVTVLQNEPMTNLPKGPISLAPMPQPTAGSEPNVPNDQPGTDGQNQTSSKRDQTLFQNYC